MRNMVVFKALLCLMYLIFAASSEAQSAPAGYQTEEGRGKAVFVQLDWSEESENPSQIDQDQVLSDFGQVEDDQPTQAPTGDDQEIQEDIEGDFPVSQSDTTGEDHPATEPNEIPSDERQREPSSSDQQYPSPDTGDTQEEYPTDVTPGGTATTQTGAGAAGGVASQQAVSQKCNQASGHSIFRLTSAGINSGASYFQPGAQVEFWNDSSVTHQVVITPSGIFSNDSFTITGESKVLMFASSPGEVTGGSIVVNLGSGQTVHDIVICP